VIEQGTILTLADVRKMVGAQEESGENPQEKISVIYAQKSVLKSLLAPASVLAKLSHARESSLRLNLDNPASGNMYCEMWDSKNRLAHAAHLPADATEKKKQIKLDAGNLKPGIYTVKVTIGGKNITVKPEKITVTPNDEFGHKVAVVVANRLPKP